MSTTTDSRIVAAQELGKEQAEYEQATGHTDPRDFTKDGDPNAGAYSHLTAAGFTRLRARDYAPQFIEAYRAEFPPATTEKRKDGTP